MMNYVTIVSYTVGDNDNNSASFLLTRSLRQGDLLSPYLFLLCTEGFLAIMNDAKRTGMIRGTLVGRERLTVNHLFFTDDNILFGTITNEGALNV